MCRARSCRIRDACRGILDASVVKLWSRQFVAESAPHISTSSRSCSSLCCSIWPSPCPGLCSSLLSQPLSQALTQPLSQPLLALSQPFPSLYPSLCLRLCPSLCPSPLSQSLSEPLLPLPLPLPQPLSCEDGGAARDRQPHPLILADNHHEIHLERSPASPGMNLVLCLHKVVIC